MTIDERLQALTMNLELFSRELESMRVKAEAYDKLIQGRINMLITAA
jgi:hypothetical protein